MSVDWYTDFVKNNYRPKATDIVVEFHFQPAGVSTREAAGRIASESSAGTWTTLTNMPKRVKSTMATAFNIKKNYCKVAYPIGLWEKGNAPQLLSGIAGNIFGMKALKTLRLVDVHLPKVYLRSYKGPKYGVGVLKRMKVRGRPLTGAVSKPKIGWSAAEHAKIGFETWMGGFDLVKDDENLTSTSFNRFEDRVRFLTKMRDKAEKVTGDKKSALINITGPTHLMEKRARMLHNYGWEYAMIDVVTCGTAAVQTMRNVCGDYNLAIHAHRAMHASFDRGNHGMTMKFLAKLMRMIGVDQIHIGTVVGKLVGTKEEILQNKEALMEKTVHKQALPVSSGGIHPGLVPDVLKILGNDICLLVSGGIHGHPKGTRAGATASMQAIEAHNKRVSLEEYSKNHKELAQALKKWGHLKPK